MPCQRSPRHARIERHAPTSRRIRTGFTLIELLIIIAIIAVLISMMLPVLGQARAAGRQSVCLSNARLLSMAALMYAHDDSEHRFVGWAPGRDRKMLLLPYTRMGKNNADTDPNQLWHCPEIRGGAPEAGYGLNTRLNWLSLIAIKNPAETVSLGDGGRNDSFQPRTATHLFPPSATTTGGICRPNPRHLGAPNIGWIDGHADLTQMAPPFYPDTLGAWFGNGVTDPTSPDYKDEMWDEH